MENEETWLPVPSFEGLYEASSFGRVKSIERILVNSVGIAAKRKSVVLKGTVGNYGEKQMYENVVLYRDGGRYRKGVHQIICETFEGPRPPGALVRHMDGNGFNNIPANVRWGTHKENIADQFRLGERGVGELSSHSKLTNADVRHIKRLIANGATNAAIGRQFNTTRTNISSIAHGKTWAHLDAS